MADKVILETQLRFRRFTEPQSGPPAHPAAITVFAVGTFMGSDCEFWTKAASQLYGGARGPVTELVGPFPSLKSAVTNFEFATGQRVPLDQRPQWVVAAPETQSFLEGVWADGRRDDAKPETI